MEILGTTDNNGIFAIHYIANHKLRHIHPDDREAVKQKMREDAAKLPGFKPWNPDMPKELKKASDINDKILHHPEC